MVIFGAYASGARISTVTDVGPAAVGERRVADLNEVAECALLALDPRRDPIQNNSYQNGFREIVAVDSISIKPLYLSVSMFKIPFHILFRTFILREERKVVSFKCITHALDRFALKIINMLKN